MAELRKRDRAAAPPPLFTREDAGFLLRMPVLAMAALLGTAIVLNRALRKAVLRL